MYILYKEFVHTGELALQKSKQFWSISTLLTQHSCGINVIIGWWSNKSVKHYKVHAV